VSAALSGGVPFFVTFIILLLRAFLFVLRRLQPIRKNPIGALSAGCAGSLIVQVNAGAKKPLRRNPAKEAR
jgi:hypothetical protein